MNCALRPWVMVVPDKPLLIKSNQYGTRIEIPRTKSINYIATARRETLPLGATVTIAGSITVDNPDTSVIAVDRKGDEGMEPNFRPMLYKSMYGDNNRWWTMSGISIVPGEFSLETKLSPGLWTNVYGKSGDQNGARRRAFSRVLADCQVALTFGGGNNYGHGVRSVSGNIWIHLTHFTIK